MTLNRYPSEMAQNFWTAIVAWSLCFLLTILVSLITRPRKDSELSGLVWSLTAMPNDAQTSLLKRPVTLATVVILLAVILNIIFW